ncbi:Fis family transcriptional regulator [Litoribacillus peritrichatus]|uniref:Fis family transcriptional regulator n=1 Tax=Litoribacillus peritrichatus TaxID=718191 RepID=A0ABP7MR84_9GAMM
MRKTDKKIDNQIRKALTVVCEIALVEVEGFQWLTHLVNYDQFPKSLRVVCVFDTKASLQHALEAGRDHYLIELIQEELTALNLGIKPENLVSFDSEEACKLEHDGKWQHRL